MTTLLTITNTTQLSEFCAAILPCIWAGTNQFFQPKRHAAFKTYVYNVLKATQLSCSCTILALYYIKRLRAAYPSIQASIGSEVRLFTTALLLANKFLDDNTYTNKTWSEVSSIPVKELNIMEMEFLSALNYNIHVPYQVYLHWTKQCQSWWQPLPPVTRKRPFFDYSTIDFASTKKRHIDTNTCYITPMCKPILSWSSTTTKRNYYHNDTKNTFYF